MSNESSSSYLGACRKDIPYPSVSNESVPSLIDNLVEALYGTITKTVVDRRVQWYIPCDPNNTATILGIPRLTGEGLLCYIIRVFNENLTLQGNFSGTFQGNLIGGVAGSVVWQSAVNTTQFLPAGLTGQVLVSKGTYIEWNDPTSTLVANAINGGLAGQVLFQSAPSVTGFTAVGAVGSVLTSAGSGTPVWTAQSGLTSGKSSNLVGGVVGDVPYQSATDTTSFVAGTANQLLQSNGAAAPTFVSSINIVNATLSGDANISGNVTGNAAITINTQSIVNSLIFG
jgi:hypothetical protein